MSSLRLALKLSMAEAKPESSGRSGKGKKTAAPAENNDKGSKFALGLEEPTLDEILSGRKRKSTIDSTKEQYSKSNSAPVLKSARSDQSKRTSNDRIKDGKRRSSSSNSSGAAEESDSSDEDSSTGTVTEAAPEERRNRSTTSSTATAVAASVAVASMKKPRSGSFPGSNAAAAVATEQRRRSESATDRIDSKEIKRRGSDKLRKIDETDDSTAGGMSKDENSERQFKNSGSRRNTSANKSDSTVEDTVNAVVDAAVLVAETKQQQRVEASKAKASLNKARNKKNSSATAAATVAGATDSESEIAVAAAADDDAENNVIDDVSSTAETASHEAVAALKDQQQMAEEDRAASKKRKRDSNSSSSGSNTTNSGSATNEKKVKSSSLASDAVDETEKSTIAANSFDYADVTFDPEKTKESNQIDAEAAAAATADSTAENSLVTDGVASEAAADKKNARNKKATESSTDETDMATAADLAAEEEPFVDPLPRYQSNRAAAVIAKSRLITRVVSDAAGEQQQQQQQFSKNSFGSFDAADTAQEGTATFGKKKNSQQQIQQQRKKKSLDNASDGATQSTTTATVVETDSNVDWVQCERCLKWRTVPAKVFQSGLPEIWFCEMSSWSDVFNKCSQPEEITLKSNDDSPASAAGGKSAARALGMSARGKKSVIAASVSAADFNAEKEDIKNRFTGAAVSRRKNFIGDRDDAANNSNSTLATATTAAATATPGTISATTTAATTTTTGNATATASSSANTPAVDWVQCNRCRKWRKVPQSIDVESLPEKWYCQMNSWAPEFARCAAKQESDDQTTSAAAAAAGKDSYHTTGAGAVSSTTTVAASAAGAAASGAVKGKKSTNASGAQIKQMNWVQCERRNCKKWRKVPGSIDIDSLPEKWYCEMNSWDMDAASCDIPEDSDSDENPAAKTARSQFINMSSSKENGAPSYRRIIFGQDGRIRVCFSDKNKNGYGIFSYSEAHKPASDADDYEEPTRRVSYWYSTAYDDSKVNAVSAASASIAGSTAPAAKASKKNSSTASLAVAAATTATTAVDVENTSVGEKTVYTKPIPESATYLLDAIRRLHAMKLESSLSPATAAVATTLPDIEHCWPKKLSRSWKIVTRMPLLKRRSAESAVFMSCFMSAPRPLQIVQSASQQQQQQQQSIELSKMQDLIATARFPDDELEACRECMSLSVLKSTVRRLEEEGKLEVTYTTSGNLVVSVLPPVTQLTTHNYQSRGAAATALGISSAWTKLGMPLKMRKFFSKSHARDAAVAAATAAVAEESATSSRIVRTESVGAVVRLERQQLPVNSSSGSISVNNTPWRAGMFKMETAVDSVVIGTTSSAITATTAADEVLTKPFRLRHSAERWQSPVGSSSRNS